MRIPSFIVLIVLLFTLAGCSQPLPATPTTAVATSAITAEPTADTSRQAELLARIGKGKIHDAIYTPDGKFILVGFDTGIGVFKSNDLGEVSYWDMPEKPLVLALIPAISEIAASTSEGNIFFVGFDQSSGVLSSSNRTPLVTNVRVRDEDNDISILVCSPDGKFIAHSANNTTQAWNLETGEALLKEGMVKPHTYQFSFSGDSNYLLLSEDNQYSPSNQNYLINLDNGEFLWTKESKAVLLAGNDLMYWTEPEEFIVSPISDLKTQNKFKFPMKYDKLVFSPDNSLCAMIRWDFGAMLFDTAKKQSIYNFEGPPSKLESTEAPIFLSNEGVLATYKSKLETITPEPGSKPVNIIYTPLVLDLGKGNGPGIDLVPEFVIPYLFPPITFAPDGHNFTYFNRSTLVQVNPDTKASIVVTDEFTSGITALAYSPDGQTLAAGQQYFSVAFLDSKQGLKQTRVDSLQNDPGITYRYPGVSRWFTGVTGLAFFPDGKRLAAVTSNGALNLITQDGSLRPVELNPHEDRVQQGKGALVEMFGLAISPDGKTIATGGYDKALRLWQNLQDVNPTSSVFDDSDIITSTAFSPDGSWIASGTESGFIRLWRSNGTLERTLRGHTGRVTGMVFSGDKVFTVSEDSTARIWMAADGSQARLINLGEPGTSLALDPRNELLALGTQSGKTFIWDVVNDRWLGMLPGVGIVRVLAFNPDGTRLAIGYESGQIQLWRVRQEAGQAALFPAGDPQTAKSSQGACKLDGQVTGFTGGTYTAGEKIRLNWETSYSGDCSTLDANSIRELENPAGLAAKYTLVSDVNYSGNNHRLQILADVTLPEISGTHRYTWELSAPDGKSLPFSALITVIAPPAGLGLPAPLYFISDSNELMRLGKVGVTLSPIIEAPVECMDISPSNGEIAYLSDDALILADPNGDDRRVLLAIGGCPSWSPDGTQISYTLNGVKVINVSTGEIKSLGNDLNAYGIQAWHYVRVLDWSPFSNKFIVNVGGWDYLGLSVIDVPTGFEFSLQGFTNPSWSWNGENIYTAEYNNYAFGWYPFIIRTNILTGASETLMGDLEIDMRGGFAPFETLDRRLLVYASQISDPDAEQVAMTAAQMPLNSPGQFTYDPNSHPIVSPTEALWWRDGTLTIIKTAAGDIVATYPFSKTPNITLPVHGRDLRWNTSDRVDTTASTQAAPTISPPGTSTAITDLSRYTLGFIGGGTGTSNQAYTIHGDGSNLMSPYPPLAIPVSMNQVGWTGDGQSMFVLAESGGLFKVRKQDEQHFDYVNPEGLPRFAAPDGGGYVKGFSISPDGRYMAVVYTPGNADYFKAPDAEQRLWLDNLGILDLQNKRWIDVNIPAITSNTDIKSAIILSPSGWSKDSLQFVATVIQSTNEMGFESTNGISMVSYKSGGGTIGTAGLVVVDVTGNYRNITLGSDPQADSTEELLPVWAADGTIYFYSTDETDKPGLYHISPDGKGQTRFTDVDRYSYPVYSVSPDGSKIAIRTSLTGDGPGEWSIINTAGKEIFSLSPGVNPAENPVWSPDGSKLAWFGSDETTTPKILITNSDGSNLTGFSLPVGVNEALHLSWSPDGRWLAFRFNIQTGGNGLYVLSADGKTIQLVSQDLLDYAGIQWSPAVTDKP